MTPYMESLTKSKRLIFSAELRPSRTTQAATLPPCCVELAGQEHKKTTRHVQELEKKTRFPPLSNIPKRSKQLNVK